MMPVNTQGELYRVVMAVWQSCERRTRWIVIPYEGHHEENAGKVRVIWQVP